MADAISIRSIPHGTGAILILLAAHSACDPEPATTFPLSGQDCAPEDAAKVLDTAICPLASTGVT